MTGPEDNLTRRMYVQDGHSSSAVDDLLHAKTLVNSCCTVALDLFKLTSIEDALRPADVEGVAHEPRSAGALGLIAVAHKAFSVEATRVRVTWVDL